MIRITLRLPEDIHARVAAQAEADRRSLNSEITYLLETGLRLSKEVEKQAPPE